MMNVTSAARPRLFQSRKALVDTRAHYVLLSRKASTGREILVAAPGKIDHHQMISSVSSRQSPAPVPERAPISSAGNDALKLAAQLETPRRLRRRWLKEIARVPYRSARRAPDRCRDSRDRQKSNALLRSGRRHPSTNMSGCRAARPARPPAIDAACLQLLSP